MSRENINPHLSVVIPTYNRANYLDYSLEIHLPLFEKYGIKLYIFDNASTDNTYEVIEKWRQTYSLIEYHRSDKNYGPDNNFKKALNYPVTRYTWLLGDTYQIPEAGIIYLLNLVEKGIDYSVIVFNLANIVQLDKAKAINYINYSDLLADLGALMTCLSCLVYNQEFLKLANFRRYEDSYFIQTGIIFEALPDSSNIVHWVQSISVDSLKHNTVKNGWYYTHDVFEIACKHWMNFVFSLPVTYALDAKLKCLIDFGKISGIFTFTNLLNLRRLDILNLASYRKYSRYFSFTIKPPKIVIISICLIPRFILKNIIAVAVLLFRKNKYDKCKRIFRNEI
jgi:glycosyltransferase involved in cell wall biosynthesis